MAKINPFELDPYEAREEFDNYLHQIERHFLSQMWDVNEDISYILQNHYHPENMSNIHPDIIDLLIKNGLEITATPKETEKANEDYYLAAFYGLETCNNFFENYKNMEFESLVSNLTYAKSQLAIMDALSPTGEPKHKTRSTDGQRQGANITNSRRYKLTRQRAYTQWEIYKKDILEWEVYKENLNQFESKIDEILKEFEESFLRDLSAFQRNKKKKTQEETDMINEMYTDSSTKPPIAIGWIKEIEGLPDRVKEKRAEEKFKDSPYFKYSRRPRNE